MTITGRFLGLAFRIDVDDVELAAHLDRVYRDACVEPDAVGSSGLAALPEPRQQHRFELRSDASGFDVVVDGELVERHERARPAVAALCWNLHRHVVATDPRSVLLHAGGVERDGRVVIVLGASGAGKTTAVAALSRAGYGYMTDDVVELRPDGTLIGAPKPLGLRSESVALLGVEALLPEIPERLVGRGKTAQRQVAASALGARVSTGGEPAVVVRLERGFPHADNGDLRRSYGLAGLVENAVNLTERAGDGFQQLAGLARSSRHHYHVQRSLNSLKVRVDELMTRRTQRR